MNLEEGDTPIAAMSVVLLDDFEFRSKIDRIAHDIQVETDDDGISYEVGMMVHLGSGALLSVVRALAAKYEVDSHEAMCTIFHAALERLWDEESQKPLTLIEVDDDDSQKPGEKR